MAQYHDHVIVLKTRPYREADNIVTVFGLKAGKMGAVAKGARRSKSALAASAHPLTYGIWGFYRGRSSLETVLDVELVDGFVGIRADLITMSWGSILADVVDALWSEKDPAPDTFMILVAGLQSLSEARDATTVGLTAIYRILEIAGYLPSWQSCKTCHDKLATPTVWVTMPSFTVQCMKCHHMNNEGDRPLSLGSVKTLQQWLSVPLSKMGQVEVKGKIKTELVQLAMQMIQVYGGRIPKAFDLLSVWG